MSTTSQSVDPVASPAWNLSGWLVNLYAEEVETAIAFYTALGFEETYRFPAEGAGAHVEVRSGGLTIGVSTLAAARAVHGFEVSQDGSSVEIVLWCDDSDAAYAQAIAAGATALHEPHDFQNGRLHVGRVFDPLGNPLAFVQKREP